MSDKTLTVVAPLDPRPSGLSYQSYHFIRAFRNFVKVDLLPIAHLQGKDIRDQLAQSDFSSLCSDLKIETTLDEDKPIIWLITQSYLKSLKKLPKKSIIYLIFERDFFSGHELAVLERCLSVWVLSHWAKSRLISRGIAETKIFVVPEGIDGRCFYPRSEDMLPQSPFKFFCVGKIEKRKGYDVLLPVFNQLYSESKAVELYICSNGAVSLAQIRAQLHALGVRHIPSNVFFLEGIRSQSELAEVYACMSAFILPTRAEGWGLPILEAGAMGLPVITSYVSGQTEFLREVRTDLLLDCPVQESVSCPIYYSGGVDYGYWARIDEEQLAAAMLRVVSGYPRYKKQALKNAALYRTWTWERSAETAAELCENLNLCRSRLLD